MATQVIVHVERGKGNFYSAYIKDNPLPYGVIGDGYSVSEAIADFKKSYEEMKAHYLQNNEPFQEAEFSFQYDVPSFLKYYQGILSLAGMERMTGISQQQLSQYLNGTRRPSPKTSMRIQDSIHTFGAELSQMSISL